MNIYDFDNTIYNGDTNKDLVIYALKKYPKLVIPCLKKARKLNKDYKNGLIEFERVKEALFAFIFQINNYPKFLNEFVSSHSKKIKSWYLTRRTEHDVIVSASYDLWINLFARYLGVRVVIATKVDSNGKIIGKNCKGPEKVRRVKEMFPSATITTAYGDSETDKDILELASTAYVVEGNKLKSYSKGYKFKNK